MFLISLLQMQNKIWHALCFYKIDMKNTFLERTWISPLAGVAFAVMAVTGALIFFNIKNGPLMVLHEWFGWVFIIAGMLHLLLNWRSFASYFTQRKAQGTFLVVTGLIVCLIFIGANKHGGGRPRTQTLMVLDVNGDGVIDNTEISNSRAALLKLDRNGDGKITTDELMEPRLSPSK